MHARQVDLITDRYDLQGDYKDRTAVIAAGQSAARQCKWRLTGEEGTENTWRMKVKGVGCGCFLDTVM
jgi:hypothetical protein